MFFGRKRLSFFASYNPPNTNPLDLNDISSGIERYIRVQYKLSLKHLKAFDSHF